MRIFFELELGSCYMYDDFLWVGKNHTTLIRLDGPRVIQCQPLSKPEPQYQCDCKTLKKAWNCTTEQLDRLSARTYPRDPEKGKCIAYLTSRDLFKIYKVALDKKDLPE